MGLGFTLQSLTLRGGHLRATQWKETQASLWHLHPVLAQLFGQIPAARAQGRASGYSRCV